MGRLSRFERQPDDWYPTPAKSVQPLLPFLPPAALFLEPCAGDGRLVRHLEAAGHICLGAFDIAPRASWVRQADARSLRLGGDGLPVRRIITNPPYDPPRELMHALIRHFREIAEETWLLLEANWAFSARAAEHLSGCTDIVPAGRMKMFEGTRDGGKQNFAWYRFEAAGVCNAGPPRFWPVGVYPERAAA